MKKTEFDWESDTELRDIVSHLNDHLVNSPSRFAIIGVVVANAVEADAACIKTDFGDNLSDIENADYWQDAMSDVEQIYEDFRVRIAIHPSKKAEIVPIKQPHQGA